MTMPLRGRVLRRLQLHHLGLQQHALEQLVDALRRSSPNLHEHRVAAPFFGNDFVRGEFLHDALGVGFRLVDLVERNDDRHIGGLRVM